MSTRAAAAANSRRAKQQLVNLLFKADYGGKGRDAHRKLDFASYSYVDLKSAYLERIKLIHPDRIMHQGVNSASSSAVCNVVKKNSAAAATTRSDVGSTKGSHNEFVELQEAWDAYEKIAKTMKRGQSDSRKRGVQENFTLFGVGCSFSDSVEESSRRAEIMDQAGKGWCLAGQLSEFTTSSTSSADNETANRISLIDDELFSTGDHNVHHTSAKKESKRKSLIDYSSFYK